jgi:hypothetical protein
MSLNTHNGCEQSRRDDLEAIGYVLLYFLRGSLPWQGLKTESLSERYREIGRLKREIKITKMCEGFPLEFTNLLLVARTLGFTEAPDYDYLIGTFETLLKSKDLMPIDWKFDWINIITQINDTNSSNESAKKVTPNTAITTNNNKHKNETKK